MKEALLQYADILPKPLGVFLIATLPIFELRGAIPWGYAVDAGSMLEIYLLAVAGNFVPVLPIMLLLGPAERHLRRFRTCDRFLNWLFARTMRRSDVIRRYQAIGVTLFVAIPLPVTGAWTGSVAAYLFKLPMRYSVPCVLLGIMLAGVIVTLVSQGVITIWSLH